MMSEKPQWAQRVFEDFLTGHPSWEAMQALVGYIGTLEKRLAKLEAVAEAAEDITRWFDNRTRKNLLDALAALKEQP
jgi:hypothetical protein